VLRGSLLEDHGHDAIRVVRTPLAVHLDEGLQLDIRDNVAADKNKVTLDDVHFVEEANSFTCKKKKKERGDEAS